uniref:LRRNT domain-containing protein n=1 Tax=Branchiostoma floridae TaxID=7739 RepID=C3ZLE8_BRAFL|eukprot:XP_002590574.1 hypothetical protein BRAFLDRAFT_83791 [Branchiostoma floridae]
MMKAIVILCALLIVVCVATPAKSETLPKDCIQSKTTPSGNRLVLVTCTDRGLTSFPDDIPSDTYNLKLMDNKIRHVPHIPPLKNLRIFGLGRNLIETLSWSSLCNLSAGIAAFDNSAKHGGTSSAVDAEIEKRDEPAFGTVHIIIMISAGLLGLVFVACVIFKLIKHRRNLELRNRAANVLQHQNTVPFQNPVYGHASDSADPTGPTLAIELSQLVPPIQNVSYHHNNPARLQTSTNIELSQLVPPIANSLYCSDNPATMPNQPHLQNPLPPIQNVCYHSNKSGGLPTEAQKPEHTYNYIP